MNHKKRSILEILLTLILVIIVFVIAFSTRTKQEARKEASNTIVEADLNSFSFGIHAPYNSPGELDFEDRAIFLNYIDNKINKLEANSPGAIEIIRDSGITGLITALDYVEVSEGCQNEDASCKNAHFLAEPNRGWNIINETIDHTLLLGKETMLEINLKDKVEVNGKLVNYRRDLEDIEILEQLLRKAMLEKNYKNKVKYWQIGNEPGNNKWTEKIQTEKGEVLAISYTTYRIGKVIKELCPNCKIVLAGAGGDTRESYLSIYYHNFLSDLTKLDPEKNSFDAFDFHFHNLSPLEETTWQKIENRFNKVKELLESTGYSNIPIWMTEMSSYSGSPAPDWGAYTPRTEEQQAIELVKRFLYPFSLGVKKIFLPGLLDRGTYAGIKNNYFSNVGIITKTGQEKESFKAISLLLKHFSNFETAEIIYSSNQPSKKHRQFPNLYLLKFDFQDKQPSYALWNENSSETTSIDLSDIISEKAKILTINGEETGESLKNINANSSPKFIISSSAENFDLSIELKFQAINKQSKSHNIKLTLIEKTSQSLKEIETTVFSNNNGVYLANIENIPSGTYDIYVKGWVHLQKKFENIAVYKNTSIDLTSKIILTGNCTDQANKEIIDIADFAVLANNYQTTSELADFDDNDVVDIIDFAILAGNYNKVGDRLP